VRDDVFCTAAATTIGNGSRRFFDECAFGDVNHGGSLSPKAGTGHEAPFARGASLGRSDVGSAP
jgi:hypothetical protein